MVVLVIKLKKFLFVLLISFSTYAQSTTPGLPRYISGGGGGSGTSVGSSGTVQTSDGAGGFGNSGLYAISAVGTSTTVTGLSTVLVNPFAPAVAEGFGNFAAAEIKEIFASGQFEPADYGNTVGQINVLRIFNGRNSSDNADKKTQDALVWDVNFMGAGQRAGSAMAVGCYGVGDCLGHDSILYGGSYNTAGGDEGLGGANRLFQVSSQLSTTITTVTTSSCSTTLSADVAKSTSATDIKTVAVGSTTGCNVGDYVTVGQGSFESGDVLHDTVQLTAVAGGAISALFQSAHSSGAPVAGAIVLVLASMPSGNTNDQNLGVGRVVVETNALTYTTGTISSVSGATVTGSGTTWTTGMVGGNANLVGCISFDNQTTTHGPWSGGLKSWFPIKSRDSNTQLTTARQVTDFPGYPTTFAGSTYTIAPCARIETLQVAPVTNGMTISAVVLESNSFTWTAGKTVIQSVSPYSTMQRMSNCYVAWYGPVQELGSCFEASNDGYVRMGSAYNLARGASANLAIADFQYGIRSNVVTSSGFMSVTGEDENGIGLDFSTFTSGAPSSVDSGKDEKLIRWVGSGGASYVASDPSTGNLLIQAGSACCNSLSLAFNTDALTARRIITWRDQAGPVGFVWVQSADPTCSTTADIGKIWFDTTTTTTARKTCNNVSGSRAWVSF